MFSACLFVRPFVRFYQLVNTIFWNDFAANWHKWLMRTKRSTLGVKWSHDTDVLISTVTQKQWSLLSSKFLASVTQYAPLLRSLFRRLSVCPTVMGVNCEKTEEFLQNLFAPTGRPGIWLGREKIARKYSQPSPPPGGGNPCYVERVWKTTNISLCLRNDKRYGHSYSKGKKGKGVYSSSWNSPQNYGTPLVNGITQWYLPPDRGDRPAFTPTGQVGTRFIDPVRMKGWVGLVGWLHTEMVYPSTVEH